MSKRSFLISISSLALAVSASFAQAQTAIDKPLKIVVGFPAGGASDVMARLLADQLRGDYAPTVLVDNKAGAGGRLAAQAVKSGEADGSQILLTPTSILTIYPHVYKKLGYDSLTDFTPVSTVASVSFALSVSSSVPATVKSVADYIKWAKANPNEANFGSAAAGAAPHFVGVMLGRAGGVDLNHVAFKGGAPLVNDLLGGQVQSGVNVLPEVLPHANSGKLRILAVSGGKRSRYLPGVPTFAESGFKGVEADEYFAVFAPAKMPAHLVAKLNASIRKALKAPALVEGLEKMSFEIGGESQPEFAKLVKNELTRWAPVVKASGFTADE